VVLGPVDPTTEWVQQAKAHAETDSNVKLWLYLAWESGFAAGFHALMEAGGPRQVLNPFQVQLVELCD
jgi:hypothetical protein